MKLIIPILILWFSSEFCFSQNPQGKFEGIYDSYVYFDNGIAEFCIAKNGGLYFPTKGIGTYSISPDYLFLHTVDFTISKKKYYSKEVEEDIVKANSTIVFQILSISEKKISMILLDIDTTPKIYTEQILKLLQYDAKQNMPFTQEYIKE